MLAALLGALFLLNAVPVQAQTVWEAALTVRDLSGSNDNGCNNEESASIQKCSNSATLTEDEFTVGGQNYRVSRITNSSGRFDFGFYGTPNTALRALNLCVDTTSFPLSSVVDSGGSIWLLFKRGGDVDFVWSPRDRVSLSIGSTCGRRLTLTPGPGQLTATWTPTTSSYDVQYRNFRYHKGSWQTGWTYAGRSVTTSSLTIPNLTNGDIYDVRIAVAGTSESDSDAWTMASASPTGQLLVLSADPPQPAEGDTVTVRAYLNQPAGAEGRSVLVSLTGTARYNGDYRVEEPNIGRKSDGTPATMLFIDEGEISADMTITVFEDEPLQDPDETIVLEAVSRGGDLEYDRQYAERTYKHYPTLSDTLTLTIGPISEQPGSPPRQEQESPQFSPGTESPPGAISRPPTTPDDPTIPTQDSPDTDTPPTTSTTASPGDTASPDGGGSSPGEPSDTHCGESDTEYLGSFYDATGGDAWNNNENWNSEEPLDQWFGVETDEDGRVISLRLADNNLSGDDMPTEELLCLEPKELALWDNDDLSGEVPEELVLAVERAALRDIAEMLDLNPQWFENYEDPFNFEDWYEGVTTDDEGRVTELDLPGEIPESIISQFKKLREIMITTSSGGCALSPEGSSAFGLFLLTLFVFAVVVRKRAR